MSENSIRKSSSKVSQNIKVFVRVRPFNSKQDSQRSCIASLNEKNISLKQKESKQPHNFTFDKIFQSTTTQSEVYETVGSEIVSSAFDGINGTIFCYGQTSSGKTHTCLGPDFKDETHSGIVPRLIKQTLYRIQNGQKNIDAKMKISMVEIYNQKIKDLLDPSKSDLKIRSNKKQGIFLQNLTEKYILSQEEAFHYLTTGIHNRSVAATNMNSQSSRSHMVFIINLTTHDIYSGHAKSSKIILVDLAGSEKISKTGAQGKVLQEAKKINTSLTALGKVINALSDGKNSHVPYRDSKLTRLLQQSLGGNSLTNLIINVSPSSYNQCETLTSVRFGQRAKAIKNQPIVNRTYTVQQLLSLLKKAEETIQKQNLLIKQLSSKKRTGGYGALSIPSVTLHILPDQEQVTTNRSIDCQSENTQNNEQQTQKSSDSLASQPTLKIKLPKSRSKIKSVRTQNNSQRSPKILSLQKSRPKCQTLTEFPSQKQTQSAKLCRTQQNFYRPVQCRSQSGQDRKVLQSVENTINRQSKYASKFHNFKPENVILQDAFENIVTPRNVGRQVGNVDRVEQKNELLSSEQNIDKIRKNLFQLKLRYMQQKRQNNIKSMIIERKNRIIEKVKNQHKNKQIR